LRVSIRGGVTGGVTPPGYFASVPDF